VRSALSAIDGAGRHIHDYCIAKLLNAERVYNDLALSVEMQGYALLTGGMQEVQVATGSLPTTDEISQNPPRYTSSLPAVPAVQPYSPVAGKYSLPEGPTPVPGDCPGWNPALGDYFHRWAVVDPAKWSQFHYWPDYTPTLSEIQIATVQGDSQFGKGKWALGVNRGAKSVTPVALAAIDQFFADVSYPVYATLNGPTTELPKCYTTCTDIGDKEVTYVSCFDSERCKYYSFYDDPCLTVEPGECTDEPIVESECDEERGVVVETTTDPCTGESYSKDAGPCPIEVPQGCCPPPEIIFSPTIEPAEVKVELFPPCKDEDGEEIECPELEPPKEPVRPGTMRFGLDWDDPRACEQLYALLGQQGALLKDFIEGWIPPECLDPNTDLQKVVLAATDNHAAIVKPITRQILMAVYTGLRWATTTDQRNLGCGSKELVPLTVAKALLGIAQRWIGVDTSELQKWIGYGLNSVCPTTLPSAADAHMMYLKKIIDDKQWECLIRANNLLPKWQEKVVASLYTRPNVRDAISLWLRGKLTADGLDQILKELGVHHFADRERFVELAKFVPPYTDIVRMMTRDSADDTVATLYGYDEELPDKYKGKLKEWAKAQGIEDELMKFIWRAHWHLPSAGQAYAMMHRLRPEKNDPDTTTKPEDVEKLLGINDIPKFWRKRLMAISYNVLRLVDLRNMYLRSVIGDDAIVSQLQDRGYTAADAQLTLLLFQRNKDEWILGRPESKSYAAGDIGKAEFMEALARYNVPAERFDDIIARLDEQLLRRHRKLCIVALRKRYLCGELDDALAIGNLTEFGFDGDEATRRVDLWKCERLGKCRQATASQLCQWYQLGLLTGPDLRGRLQLLGYSRDAAIGIAAVCVNRADRDRARQARQKQIDEDKKKCPPKSCDDKKRDKANVERERERKRAAGTLHLKATVLSKVMKTARKLARLQGSNWSDVIDDVRNMMCELTEAKGIDETDSLALIDELIAGAEEDERSDIAEDYERLLEMLPPGDQTGRACIVAEISQPAGE